MPREPENGIYRHDPDRCPFTAAWRAIGGKWKGVLWWRLSHGLGRFGALQRAIPLVSRKVLAQQLRDLERDGIVRRTVLAAMPAHVEYALTAYGQALAPVIDALCAFGARHLERRAVETPRTGG